MEEQHHLSPESIPVTLVVDPVRLLAVAPVRELTGKGPHTPCICTRKQPLPWWWPQVEEYEGGRTLKDLVAFVNEKVGASIELTAEDAEVDAASAHDEEEEEEEGADVSGARLAAPASGVWDGYPDIHPHACQHPSCIA